MTIYRQFPANPNMLIYHVAIEMTKSIADIFHNRDEAVQAPLALSLFEIEEIKEIHYTRYQVRLRKHRMRVWDDFLSEMEGKMSEHLMDANFQDFIPENRWRTFSISAELGPSERLVFEGWDWAQEYPLASRIFEVDGVAEIIFEGQEIKIGKGHCFAWKSLAPKIERLLMNTE